MHFFNSSFSMKRWHDVSKVLGFSAQRLRFFEEASCFAPPESVRANLEYSLCCSSLHRFFVSKRVAQDVSGGCNSQRQTGGLSEDCHSRCLAPRRPPQVGGWIRHYEVSQSRLTSLSSCCEVVFVLKGRPSS